MDMSGSFNPAKKAAVAFGAGALFVGAILYGKFYTPTLTAKPLVEFEKATDAEKYKDRKLTAHRGLSAIAPENTLPSYEAAGKKGGFYAIECDAYCTTDNVWVIMHDNDVRKMTDQTGKVTDFSYDELRRMKFDNGANYKDFDDLHVCTVKEYIDVCKKYGCRPQIEIKDGRVEKLGLFYNLLKEEGILDSVIVISFNYKALKYLRGLDGNLEIWYIVNFITDKVIKVRVIGKNDIGIGGSRFDRDGISVFIAFPFAGLANQFYHFSIAFGRRLHSSQFVKSILSIYNTFSLSSAFLLCSFLQSFLTFTFEKSCMCFIQRRDFAVNPIAEALNVDTNNRVKLVNFFRGKLGGQSGF